MLAAAAVRAVWREVRGHNDWELTAHVGAHIQPEPVPSHPAVLQPAGAA